MIRLKEKTVKQKVIETNQRILALSSGDGDEGNRGRAGLIPAIKDI